MPSTSSHSKVNFVWYSYMNSDSWQKEHGIFCDEKGQREENDPHNREDNDDACLDSQSFNGNAMDSKLDLMKNYSIHGARKDNTYTKPHISQIRISDKYEHDIDKKRLEEKMMCYELARSIENQGFLSCPVCMEKYEHHQVQSDGYVDLKIPVHSQACDHTICYGCVCRIHQILLQSCLQKKWVKCPMCNSKQAFQPQRPIVSRMTMELIRIQDGLNCIT